MNMTWSRFLKAAYRRQPVVSFVVTAGVVNVLLGGVEGQTALMVVGASAASAAIAWRWFRLYQQRPMAPSSPPIHYLPDHGSRPQMPMLTRTHRQH